MATPSLLTLVSPKLHASNIGSIKALVDSNPYDVADHFAPSIPVIDFSLLTSQDPLLRSDVVSLLGKACAEWGFFMITNHGISEKLMEEVMKKSQEFHELPVEEKKEFADKGTWEPIRYGTSYSPQTEKVHYWKDFLKVITFPQFNFPNKPHGFREVAYEYSRKTREVTRTLLQGISESLGLKPMALEDYTGFDSGVQVLNVNLYPPCPQPEEGALGMPPHTDHGLLTMHQNDIGSLQVKHDGKWVNVHPLPNCLLVNVADQLEAVTNGKCKSVLHRVVLNNAEAGISIVIASGPEVEKEIGPAPELVENEGAFYKTMKYKDYF